MWTRNWPFVPASQQQDIGTESSVRRYSKTSQPQTWHAPRGEKIHGKAVQDLEVNGYSHGNRDDGCEVPQVLRSTLYNPIRGNPIGWKANINKLQKAMPNMLALAAMQTSTTQIVTTKFGQAASGSVLSYQQKLSDDYVLNICDGVANPELPMANVIKNNFCLVLTANQSVCLEGLFLSMPEIRKFEEQTSLQSHSLLWYKLQRK